MFEKNPTKNEIFDYRLRQEGVPFLLPWLTKRVCVCVCVCALVHANTGGTNVRTGHSLFIENIENTFYIEPILRAHERALVLTHSLANSLTHTFSRSLSPTPSLSLPSSLTHSLIPLPLSPPPSLSLLGAASRSG
jgi:hypothetical protein